MSLLGVLNLTIDNRNVDVRLKQTNKMFADMSKRLHAGIEKGMELLRGSQIGSA